MRVSFVIFQHQGLKDINVEDRTWEAKIHPCIAWVVLARHTSARVAKRTTRHHLRIQKHWLREKPKKHRTFA